jgi:zinc transporter ZupT
MTLSFIVYLAIIAACSILGGILPLIANWSNRSLLLPVAFSGGVLLGAAFFDMIPEGAMLLGSRVGMPLMTGFLLIFVLEHFLIVHPHPEDAKPHGQAHHIHVGATAYAGLSFHSLLDGLALSSTYRQPALGGVVTLAIVLHTIPTAFALTSLLILDRWTRSAIIGWMTLFAFSIPIGAIITWIMIAGASDKTIGIAITLSAGTFLAIATSDLLPQIRHSEHPRNLPLFFLFVGLLVCWISSLVAF